MYRATADTLCLISLVTIAIDVTTPQGKAEEEGGARKGGGGGNVWVRRSGTKFVKIIMVCVRACERARVVYKCVCVCVCVCVCGVCVKLQALVYDSLPSTTIIIIIMYIYHALINALSAHMIHINLNIFYTHVKHSPTKTIYIKYY